MAEFPAVGPAVHFPPIPVNKNDGPFQREEFLRWLQRQSVQFANLTVTGDIKSANWDGASPADLSAIDPTATEGFYLDSSEGAMQITDDLFVGRDDRGWVEFTTAANEIRMAFNTTFGTGQINFITGLGLLGDTITALIDPTTGIFSVTQQDIDVLLEIQAGTPRLAWFDTKMRLPEGTAALPALYGGAENDSGIFFAGEATAVSAGGTERARFTATAGHNLQGLAWTTWDPTFTNVTLGTGGSDYGRFVCVGRVVFFRMGFVLGTGGSVSGLIRCGFPSGFVPEGLSLGTSGIDVVGIGNVHDANTGVNYQVYVMNDINNAGLRMSLQKVDGTYTIFADASGTAPMTWAVGDSYNAYGWFEFNT